MMQQYPGPLIEDRGAQHARQRHLLHVNHPTHNPLSPLYSHVGTRGEEAVGREFDLPVDYTLRPGGDGGKDNWMWLQTGYDEFRYVKLDAKASQKPYNLIVEVGKCRPQTIYLLGGYLPAEDRVELLGWEWGKTLLPTTPRIFVPGGKLSHWLPRRKLRKIAELHARHVLGLSF